MNQFIVTLTNGARVRIEISAREAHGKTESQLEACACFIARRNFGVGAVSAKRAS